MGAHGQPAGAAGPPRRGRPLPPPRPRSALFPPRPTQPRLRPAAVPSTGRPAAVPWPTRSSAEAEAPAPGAPRYFPAPHLPPRVLTRLQGAEQPGRGPGNAAAFLEHIAQDGAHAAATAAAAAAAAAALPFQASPSAPKGAGQLVLPHPRAPWAPVRPPSAWVLAVPPAQRLHTRGARQDRLVKGLSKAAKVLGGQGTLRSTAGAAKRGAAGRDLQCGACKAEAGEDLGRGGGRERASARRRRQRSRPQSRHHRAQAGLP